MSRGRVWGRMRGGVGRCEELWAVFMMAPPLRKASYKDLEVTIK